MQNPYGLCIILMDYAKSNNLNWREDSSNKTDSYLRNKIRNNIIPEFEKLEGNFIKNFKKISRTIYIKRR